MSLTKLPVTGDIVDPALSRVASIVARKSGEEPPPNDGAAVMVLMVCGNIAQMFRIPYASDDEALLMRDVIATGLGWDEKSQIVPTGKHRQ